MPSLSHSEETLTNKIVKKWFWLYFFWYLSAPLWYIIRVLISNSPEVSVSDFWILYSIISLITFLYTYNDLWLTASLQYFLPKFFIRKEFNNIKTTIYLSLFTQIVTGIIIATWLWLWSDWLAIHYFHSEIAGTILKYFCFYFIGTNILQVIQSIFLSFQKTFEYQWIEFIKTLSVFLFSIYFFFIGSGNIENYSISRLWWLLIAIIIAIILYLKFRKNIIKWIFKIDNTTLKKYTKYALWALIWNSIWNLFGQIILQMVLYFLWPTDAWYYSNFLSLFFIGITLLWPIKSLLYPLVSEYDEKAEKYNIEKLIWSFYSYFTCVILTLSTIFIALWPEISVILFWKKYLPSWELLSYIWIFLVFNLLSSFNFQVLAWLWKVKERVFITWISCICTIIIAYFGIKFWWIIWAWIAFWISNIINWFLSLCLIKKNHYSFNIKWSFIIKNIFLCILLWMIIYYTKNYCFDTNYIFNIFVLISVIIIFFLLMWIFNYKIIRKLLVSFSWKKCS